MTLTYQNAVGINFDIRLGFDITGYTSVVYYITKPSGTKLTKTPTIISVTTGTASYESIVGDLDEVGQYETQAKVTYPDGDVIPSEIDTFFVYAPL